jgi:hypothetical protein
MLEESPGPLWAGGGYEFTGRVSAGTVQMYKGHSCNCWHVPKKYLFSSSVSWGSRVFFEDSHANQKKRIAFLLLGLGLVALFLAGLGWWRHAIILCPFFNRGMYGVVTGRFINFSSTVPSSSKYQCRAKSALFAKCIRGAGLRAWGTRMKHS